MKPDFTGQLTRAYSNSRKNIKYVGYSSLLDIAFFFLYFLVTAVLSSKMAEFLVAIGAEFSKNSANLMGESLNPTVFGVLTATELSKALLGNFCLLLLLFIVSIYILYIFFQGLNWKFAARIADVKVSYHSYLKKFMLVNIPWLVLMVVHQVLSFFVDFSETVAERFGQVLSGTPDFLAKVLLVVIAYFAIISYALIVRHKALESVKLSLKLGVRKIIYFIPRVAVIAGLLLLFAVFDKYVLSYTGSVIGTIIIGGAVLFPMLAFIRNYVFVFVGDLEKT